MDKFYPKLAYPEEIKAYNLEELPRTPIKTLVTIYKTYMGRYKLKDTISASKAQVLYIYGEKELNCVKASAKLFQQLHPNTILYEAKGYNHGYLSAYLPQEWVDLVETFFKNDSLEMWDAVRMNLMLGAIVGDIVGSVYEWDNIKTKDFPLFREDCFFTDDTVSPNSWVCKFVSETLLILKIKKPKFHYFEMKT